MARACIQSCPEVIRIQNDAPQQLAVAPGEEKSHNAAFEAADQISRLTLDCPGVCSEPSFVGMRIPRVHGLLSLPEPIIQDKPVCQSPILDR